MLNNTPEKRPILDLKMTKFDLLLEILSIAVLGFHWVFIWIYYSRLPQIIPSHIDINGKIDGMGPKFMLLYVPIIGILIHFAISYTNKKPHNFNFPYTINEENAERQYRNSLMMTRIVKLFIQLLFAAITANIIHLASFIDTKLIGLWMFPICIALMILTIFFFVFRGFKLK